VLYKELSKKILLLLLFICLLPLNIASTGFAEETGIVTLEQAVKAAQELAFRSAGAAGDINSSVNVPGVLDTKDILQANTIALNVATTVIDLDFARKKYEYLAAKQELLKIRAAKAENDFKVGMIDANVYEELKMEIAQNSFDLNYYRMQIEYCEKSYKKITGVDISVNFQFNSAYLIVDAGKIQLPSYSDQSEDSDETEKKFNDVLAAYSKLGKFIASYIKASEDLAQAEDGYKVGKIDFETVEALKEKKEQARIDALEAKAAYSKLLYELDCSLQGYISVKIKNIANPIFSPISQTSEV